MDRGASGVAGGHWVRGLVSLNPGCLQRAVWAGLLGWEVQAWLSAGCGQDVGQGGQKGSSGTMKSFSNS